MGHFSVEIMRLRGQLSVEINSLTAITADQTEINRERAKEALTEKTLGKQNRDRPDEQILRETREGAGSGNPEQGKDHGHDASRDAPQIDDDFGLGD